MQSGKFIKVAGNFNERFPVLVLEPSNLLVPGSLVFLDGTNLGLSSEDTETAPIEGVSVNNLATDYAKLIPSLSGGNADTLGCLFGGNNNGGVARAEITTKGGLHGYLTSTAAGIRLIKPKGLIASYIQNNAQDHTFFIALSHRITMPKASDATRATYSGATLADSLSLWAFDAVSRYPPAGNGHLIGYDRDGVADTTTGLVYRAEAVHGVYSTFASYEGIFDNIALWKVGDTSNWESAQVGKRRPSHILYSLYIEDLTVSGRTFAEVNAILKDRHASMFATGKYSGDTWATTPPNI